MPFVPPRCPFARCEQHTSPVAGFFRRRGFYYPACRREGVPRFRCRSCNRSFSRQTFRHDYRDKRPEINEPLFWVLIGGMSMRQAGRMLAIDIRAVQQKMRKTGALCDRLHENLSQKLPDGRVWLLDEEETYETASIRPLTMPVLIDKETWFVVATAVGSIRRLATMGTRRRQRQDREERNCRRPDQSRRCVDAVLRRLAARLPTGRIALHTDQKPSYAVVAAELFGDRLVHTTTSGMRARTTHNPLFAINTTLAMTRDNCGRLRRRSWLVTKRAECLQLHLHIFTVYRNYVRRRFNRDDPMDSSAKLLGLLPRPLEIQEVLAWRQDWQDRSIHPMSGCGSHTVRHAMSA